MATNAIASHALMFGVLQLVDFLLLVAGVLIAGPLLARRLSRGEGTVARVIAQILGFLTSASIVLVLLVVAVCHGPPPGEGPHAERAFVRAKPVLAAVLAYRERVGRYPATLAELTPADLPASALDVRSLGALEYPLEYRSAPDSFVLSFRHAGPGMNICEYSSPAGPWRCHGHF